MTQLILPTLNQTITKVFRPMLAKTKTNNIDTSKQWGRLAKQEDSMPQKPFIDLLVVAGANAGMKYTIQKGSYRILGRDNVLESETTQLTKTGDIALNYNQAIIINSHMQMHSRSKHLKALERGPDIIIDDPAVSKSHTMIFHSEDITRVVDLKSTNGTILNGKPVESSSLEEKDIIQIGSTKIMALAG